MDNFTFVNPYNVMVKPHGPVCNLACAYCYYLPKTELYPSSRFRMSDELLEEFTRQYIESQRVPAVTFSWQGGEPLLAGLDFFRRAVAYQNKYARPGMRLLNAFQTNGTLLDDEWCQFFTQNNFLIGLSLDGPEDLHNTFRVDKSGNPTFSRVMNGIDLLKKNEVKFNILATINAANAEHPLEVYRFLRDRVGAQFIQFIPIVEHNQSNGKEPGERASDFSVTGEEFGGFLIKVFDEWIRRDIERVSVQIFDEALAAWSGQHPGLCIFDRTCGTALVVEHNGDLYACDHFVDPRYKLGNILETPLIEMVSSHRQLQFGTAKRTGLLRACLDCPVLFACTGGCPKDRFAFTPGGELGLNYLCAGYKAFFLHIDRPMKMMVREMDANRPIGNVMVRLNRRNRH